MQYLLLVNCLTAAAQPADGFAQPFSFYFMDQQAHPSYFGSISWGDVDGDGDYDLVVSGNQTAVTRATPVFDVLSTVAIRKLDDAALTTRLDYESMISSSALPAFWLSSTAIADADRDGDLDVYVSGATAPLGTWSPASALMMNDREASFVPAQSSIAPLYAGSATWLDANNDAQMDLLVTGVAGDGSFHSLLYTNGDDGLLLTDSLVAVANSAVSPADFDGDGDVDLALSGRTAEGRFVTRMYRNDDGRFVDTGAGLVGVSYGSLDWGDYDNDGDPDLLLTGGQVGPFVLSGILRIYRNTGDALVDAGVRLPGPVGGAARWGDYNSDGLLDVVWTGSINLFASAASGVYENLGSGQFERRITLAGAFPSDVTWGDYDGDGDLDLTLQGLNRDRVPALVQYQNDHRLVNQVPSVPEGLAASVDGADVSLSWAQASDPETPQSGLTYNIRVGSAPGAVDVIHPLSDAATGRRTHSRPGNAWHNQAWRLRGLAQGTYYWSVQSVDASFQGSPFATEGSFTVGSGAGGDVTTRTDADPGLPRAFAVRGSYPNPFQTDTKVRFEMPTAENVRIEVYDLLGARVRVLHAGPLTAGTHDVEWDGRNELRRPVSSGVYVYRISAGSGWTGSGTMVRVP